MRFNRVDRFATSAALFLMAGLCLVLIQSGCDFRPKAPSRLRILFTSDTQGNFTPCGCAGGPRGGIERRSTAIRRARETAPGSVILLDTGNFTTGLGSEAERFKADYVARAMAELKYDAVNVGRMDARRARLGVHAYDREGFPLTSAGYTYNDEQTAERRFSYSTRIIVDVQGFKIGIVGSPLDELDKSDLGFENEPTVRWDELAEVIDDVSVKDAAGLNILISDLSVPLQQASIAASRFPLAGIVIAGESAPNEYVEERSGADISRPILIPRAASWGRSLGVLDLTLSPQGGITSYHIEYVDLNESIEKDPVFAAMTEEYLAALEKAGLSKVPEVREAGYTGSKSCQSCHPREFDSWQTTRHASAWATLEGSGRIRETTCVPCHTTGYAGTDSMPERLVPYELRGVGCESCHGPGEVHMAYQKWKIYGELTGEVRGEDLTDPIVRTPPERTCTACHTPPYDEGWVYRIKLDRVFHD